MMKQKSKNISVLVTELCCLALVAVIWLMPMTKKPVSTNCILFVKNEELYLADCDTGRTEQLTTALHEIEDSFERSRLQSSRPMFNHSRSSVFYLDYQTNYRTGNKVYQLYQKDCKTGAAAIPLSYGGEQLFSCNHRGDRVLIRNQQQLHALEGEDFHAVSGNVKSVLSSDSFDDMLILKTDGTLNWHHFEDQTVTPVAEQVARLLWHEKNISRFLYLTEDGSLIRGNQNGKKEILAEGLTPASILYQVEDHSFYYIKGKGEKQLYWNQNGTEKQLSAQFDGVLYDWNEQNCHALIYQETDGKIYLAVNGRVQKLGCENAEHWMIDHRNGKLYYLTDLEGNISDSFSITTATLMCAPLSDVQKAEVYAQDVIAVLPVVLPDGGDPVYYKDMTARFQGKETVYTTDLYIGKKLVESDETVSYLNQQGEYYYYLKENATEMAICRSKGTGSPQVLCRHKNIQKLGESLRFFADNSFAYLADYDEKTDTYSLYCYQHGKSTCLEQGVSAFGSARRSD